MSQVLLDTHFLIWALRDPDMLSPVARDAIADPEVTVLFSAVSIWEIAIKTSLGRVSFRNDPTDMWRVALATGFQELPVTSRVAATIVTLPPHHKDPFDRLLVAQAIALPARLLTADSILARYTELAWVCAA